MLIKYHHKQTSLSKFRRTRSKHCNISCFIKLITARNSSTSTNIGITNLQLRDKTEDKNQILFSRKCSYQQHVARTTPVTKKWKSNTEITT